MRNLTRLILPDLEELLGGGSRDQLLDLVEHLHPADIADLLVYLPDAQATLLFGLLDQPLKVETFDFLDEDEQEMLLARIGLASMTPVVNAMSSDERADLMKRLPQRTVERLLPLLAKAERADVKRLVSYPEGTAGSIMSTEYASVPLGLTVNQALAQLRRIAPEAEMIYYIYVLDEAKRLQGVISLQDLLLADPERRVEDVMTTDILRLPHMTDQEQVMMEVERYDLLAYPIVDENDVLVGIVTHDDILDVASEEATEDAHLMGAVSPLDEPYFKAGILELARKRGIWLAVLFLGEILTGTALRHYESLLENALNLVYFVPLIISTGGNSGSQSTTLITRGLAVGDVAVSDWWRIAYRELGLGMAMGCCLGVVGFLLALMWGNDPMVGVVIWLTIIGVVSFGTMTGSILPLFFKRIGLDPAVTSSPFVASIVDVAGILIYFSIAIWLLGS